MIINNPHPISLLSLLHVFCLLAPPLSINLKNLLRQHFCPSSCTLIIAFIIPIQPLERTMTINSLNSRVCLLLRVQFCQTYYFIDTKSHVISFDVRLDDNHQNSVMYRFIIIMYVPDYNDTTKKTTFLPQKYTSQCAILNNRSMKEKTSN